MSREAIVEVDDLTIYRTDGISTGGVRESVLLPLKSVKGELIRCKDCIYYDKPHVEKDGERYEYSDLPQSAFDTFDTKLVTLEYGINFGGRCCIDYNRGYDVDKRVFVNENNYCGRAERKEE